MTRKMWSTEGSTGPIVFLQWADGSMSTRTVAWADLKSAGSSAMDEAVAIVAAGPYADATIAAVSMGHGYVIREVTEVVETVRTVGDFLQLR